MTDRFDSLLETLRTLTREETTRSGPDTQGQRKADGSWVTRTDTAIQTRVRRWLEQQFPDIGFLGEEMSASAQEAALQTSERLWVLDPLDGTSNFRIGLPVYATTLALIENGVVTFGLVYDPCRDEMFHAHLGGGAYCNGACMMRNDRSGRRLSQAIAAVDFKRLPANLACRLATHPPYASQRSIGSIALDWCWVAAGRFDVYVHGKQKLWDHAAGRLILEEAGGAQTTLDGQEPPQIDLTPRSAVCATNQALLDEWRAALAEAAD
ncbi:MAG: inositol monophosphatase family protein [Halothiobacillaceae bacterium]